MYVVSVVTWLSAGVARSVASALADSTKAQYRGAEEIFLLFCLFMRGTQPFLPVSNELLCLYLQWRSLTVDPKKLKTGLSTIHYLHERLGHVWVPVVDRFVVHRCLMGLKRLCCTPVKQKLPITPALLAKMRRCKSINWEHPTMVIVWAAMFYCFHSTVSILLFSPKGQLHRRQTECLQLPEALGSR